jgi:hypothetical protein
MTLWERFIATLEISIASTVDPEREKLESQLTELDQRIADHNHMMHIAEMADDRYYTNGRRDRHRTELLEMQGDRKFVVGRLVRITKIN